MRITNITALITLLNLLISCSSVKVSSDTEKKDFSKLKTYNWYQWPKDPNDDSRKFHRSGLGENIVELNVNNAFIEKELIKSGFGSDTAKPDFLVRCKAFYEKERKDVNLDPSSVVRSSSWGSNSQNSAGIKMIPEKTTVVILELLAPVSEEVVWRGVKSTVVGEMLNLTGVLEKDIKDIIKKIPSK